MGEPIFLFERRQQSMNNPYPKNDGSFVIFETEEDEQTDEEEGEE
jgi:hypothetical protein